MVAGVANASRVSSAVEVASVFVPALAAEYGWSRTLIASATTMGGVATSIVSPFIGRFLDRVGPRTVIPTGALMVGVGCLVLANVQSAAVFVGVYAFVRMSGQAFVQFPNQVTVAKWFDRRRGKAMALLIGLGAIGLIAAPVVIQQIISRAGIGAAWVTLGVLALTLGVLPSLLLTARRPEDVGLRVDGRPDGDEQPDADRGSRTASRDWTLSEALATPTFWLVLASSVLFSLSSTGVGFHQLSYYLDKGIDGGIAAAVVSSFAFGLTAGGVIWGWLADRVRVQFLLMAQYAATALLIVYLLSVDSAVEGFPFAFFFGMQVGGALSLPTLLLATYYGRANLGAIAGIAQMARGLSLGSGPLVAGIFFDTTGRYESAFVTFAVMCLGSAAMMAMARRPVSPAVNVEMPPRGQHS
ncbi:MAG: MFS transporter [Dehalococcoidia bacterium]